MRGGLGHKRNAFRKATIAAAGDPLDFSATPAPLPARPDEQVVAREVNPGLAAVISITGSSSNAGKTWLCERVIEALARTGRPPLALKVTRAHESACPRQNDSCSVCDSLKAPYTIVRDRIMLDVPRKDTGRYFAAGARSVLWLLVRPRAVHDGVLAALAEVPAGSILVAEGNSFRDFVEPDLSLMMLSDRFAVKPSARTILNRVDAFVCRPEAEPHFQSLLGESLFRARPMLHPDAAADWAMGMLGHRLPRQNPGSMFHAARESHGFR